MINTPETGGGELGTIEVRAYREGRVVHRQLCETADEATAIVEAWEEQEGVECEVTDLSHTLQVDDDIVPLDEYDH